MLIMIFDAKIFKFWCSPIYLLFLSCLLGLFYYYYFGEKKFFIGPHLNIRYTGCWLARTLCTFDIDGAKTKTVTGHDGERYWEQKPDFWEENKSQSDSVTMQNLVQQNPFILQNINLLWKPGRIIWERERKATGGQQEGSRRRDRGNERRQRAERKKMELSTTEVQKLTCPVPLKPCCMTSS